jgi:MerR family copper efflux transcriptional regulator
MNIGEVAESSGVSVRMICHYEESGLIRPATRTGSNYRVYTATDVEVLRFVRRARHPGFSTRQISALQALWEDRERPSSEVKSMITQHIDDLNERIHGTSRDHLADELVRWLPCTPGNRERVLLTQRSQQMPTALAPSCRRPRVSLL